MQENIPEDSSPTPQPLEYQQPGTTDPAPAERPWFGYIGVGIALAAMLLGIAGMVAAVLYLIGWLRS